MLNNNSGYDFICGKGYKIDVKSSCRRIRKNHNDMWVFAIDKNKKSDYFLCLAFNNRKNLNPEYIWLIPNEKINKFTTIGISESRLQKWEKYELKDKINDIINCCNILKS